MAKRSARKIFADNLRRARKEQGLSQEAVAEAANIHRTYVGAVERAERNVSIDSMERLADAVGLELSEMLRRTEG